MRWPLAMDYAQMMTSILYLNNVCAFTMDGLLDQFKYCCVGVNNISRPFPFDILHLSVYGSRFQLCMWSLLCWDAERCADLRQVEVCNHTVFFDLEHLLWHHKRCPITEVVDVWCCVKYGPITKSPDYCLKHWRWHLKSLSTPTLLRYINWLQLLFHSFFYKNMLA